MKHLLLTMMALLCSMGMVMAEEDAGGKTALLKEGKSWVYDYHHFDDQDKSQKPVETVYAVEFVLRSDTVINGLDYFKLYRVIDGVASYYFAVREEGTATYMVRLDKTQEELLTEFDPSRFIYSALRYEYTEAIDSVSVNGRLFRRHTYVTDAVPDDEWFPKVIAVEGVGFEENGLVLGMDYVRLACVCDFMVFNACYEDGECIFAKDDFNAPAVTAGITRPSSSSTYQSPTVTYDLQGRRLTTMPRKGVLVEKGRKQVKK